MIFGNVFTSLQVKHSSAPRVAAMPALASNIGRPGTAPHSACHDAISRLGAEFPGSDLSDALPVTWSGDRDYPDLFHRTGRRLHPGLRRKL